MELFSTFHDKEEINVLDLGCGVGRNSIPLAKALENRKGKVVCVDLLESAIQKLQLYANKFNVEDKIECKLSDIGNYRIDATSYDFIFAVSSLEHLDSEETLDHIVADIMRGTKASGINSFIMSTNVSEKNIDSGKSLDPVYELNFDTEYLLDKLQGMYTGWKCLNYSIKPYEIEIEREGERILLHGDVLTWVVKNE
ncbi:Tellurite methyltransferase [compost metagenome]